MRRYALYSAMSERALAEQFSEMRPVSLRRGGNVLDLDLGKP
jgi:hypothetical protein